MATRYLIPILPTPFKTQDYKKFIENAMEKVASDIQKNFGKTTTTWNTRVVFRKYTTFDWNKELVAGSDTDNNIYRYVSGGVKGHKITAGGAFYSGGSSKMALAFQEKFRAKTKPGRLTSGSGGRYGKVVLRESVNWPGITARKFDETVLKERKDWINKTIQNSVVSGVRNQRHNYP